MMPATDTGTRPQLPTGTVTFLFTDIEGSTRLAHELDPMLYRELLEQHHRLVRAAVAGHGGAERGTQGDAFLVIFRDAPAAVAAAVDAQHAIAGATWPNGVAVRVRMGIHTGIGIAGGDDYVGTDINRAARIAAAAHGGQIVISDATRALAERHLPAGAALRDVGRHWLKDLAQDEHLFQVAVPDLRSEFPPLRTLDVHKGDLPARLTSFVGRDDERESVRALLTTQRLVTITGPGGTGKTSLALAVAREMAPDVPDGAWFVPLDAVADPDLIPAAVVRVLRLDMEDGRPPELRLTDYLGDRRALLVLDNFEHLQAGAPFVGRLLAAAPNIRLIVASQVPLHIDGEQEFPLDPLPVPSFSRSGAADLAVVGSNAAVRLFLDRSRAVRPDFDLDGSTADAIVGICGRLDGLPLAIELAAAQVGLLSPGVIRDRLATRIELLASRRADLPERQRTLTGAVAWSYDLLPASEKALLRHLSVFAGGGTLADIERLVADVEIVPDALSALAGLVDRSLVQRRRGREDRYSMLEAIRSYAADRLRDDGEETGAQRRHAELFVELAEEAEAQLYMSARRTWLDRLIDEHDNLRAALDRMEAAGEVEIALRLSAALWRFWQLTGHLIEAQIRVERLLALAGSSKGSLPPGLMSRAEEAAGGMGYWLRVGDIAEIRRHYERSLEYAHMARDDHRVAWATYNLSFVYDYVPAAVDNAGLDRGRAGELRDDALRRFRELGDRRGMAYALWAMGGSPVAIADEPDMLRERLREASALFHETDEAYGETWALMSLAMVEAVSGRMAEAQEAIRQGAALFVRDGDLSGQTVILDQLAALAARGGDSRLAVRLDAAGQAARRATGARVPPIPPLRGPIEAARLELESDVIAEEEAIGAAMPFEDAIASAVIGSDVPAAQIKSIARSATAGTQAADDRSPERAG